MSKANETLARRLGRVSISPVWLVRKEIVMRRLSGKTVDGAKIEREMNLCAKLGLQWPDGMIERLCNDDTEAETLVSALEAAPE